MSVIKDLIEELTKIVDETQNMRVQIESQELHIARLIANRDYYKAECKRIDALYQQTDARLANAISALRQPMTIPAPQPGAQSQGHKDASADYAGRSPLSEVLSGRPSCG